MAETCLSSLRSTPGSSWGFTAWLSVGWNINMPKSELFFNSMPFLVFEQKGKNSQEFTKLNTNYGSQIYKCFLTPHTSWLIVHRDARVMNNNHCADLKHKDIKLITLVAQDALKPAQASSVHETKAWRLTMTVRWQFTDHSNITRNYATWNTRFCKTWL